MTIRGQGNACAGNVRGPVGQVVAPWPYFPGAKLPRGPA